ncbi:sensor histidine kinase [Sphingomonas segetis]|uniref:sensor histidine kinase n=1 Tax=Sphingomonas segetis TaxID=1104779 RepID=UPI0012D362D3|nr:ATP-binding protein [Sphingomonas segetis]
MIALGRAMLALLFLVSISLDSSQAAATPLLTYGLLLSYVAYALAIAALTWRDWWLDARLAVATHFLDMIAFTAIVLATNPDTSPFFLFFILPLLSAAIRWGWRETALTATVLILFYLAGGLLVSGSAAFEMQRFVIRSGHLVILSAVLIWFGIHQQFTRLFSGVDELERRFGRDEDPFPHALNVAMKAARARSGALLLGCAGDRRFAGVRIVDGAASPAGTDMPLMREALPVLLFDVGKDRALATRAHGWYRFSPAATLLDRDALLAFGADQGLVAEVRSGTRHGWLVLWDMAELSVDFLELGLELGRAAGAMLDQDAMLSAIEEGAAAGTRLSLARDVHDSIVQFLAGAAFRVEAVMRVSRDGGQVESDLKELKRLLIEEQSEIRAFVSALRRDRELELTEAVDELRTLARRLGRQWSVDCRVDAREDGASIPIRLQLDLQQLLREAVANAVRHGRASRIRVDVGIVDDSLRLKVTDNGSGFAPCDGGSPADPWSLKERVDRAHGSLSVESEPGSTNLVITLPLTNGAAA